jgi:hypothetical protein
LRGSSETTEPPAPPSEEPLAAAVPAEEMPDWFKDLSAREPQQPELEQPQPTAQEELPAVEAQPGEIPGWLQGFRDLSTPTSEDAAPSETSGSIAEQPVAEEPPDWLKNFAPQPSASMESTLPVEQPESTLPPAEPASDIPDWLQGFSGSAESATGEPAAVPAAGGTPDWLQQTGQKTPAEESAAPSGTVEPAAGEEDWFSRLSGSMNVVLGEETPAPSLPPAEASSEIPQESPEIPSWAQGTSESEDHAASAAPSSGVSDWWSNLTLPSEGEELPSAPAEAPDWISKIPTAHEQPPVPAPVESSAAEEIVPGSEEPEWLKDVHPETSSDSAEIEAPVGATPSNASPFAGADLPGWLDGVGPALTGTEGESGAPIEMGQLPEWLQAMRPVEAIGVGKTIDDLDREVVRSGPLAGLSGVLPGEKAAERYSKPPVYSAKLRVTDQQRSQAALLETLLAEIRAPRVAVSEPTTIPQRLLRMVIGLVLIAALLAPLLTQSQHVAIPAAAAQQSLDFYQSINSLPANVPVLVVVDYGLGLSGEMQVGAKALLGQLMDKPVRLAFVSSTPEGAALAQNLLTSVSAGHPAYSVDLQAVNLGFVPGDLTGLRQFGEQPWRAVPLTLDGKNPAEISALAGIQMLRDFSAVVVLTDNVDTGRAWVEQVQPLLGGKPMLMLVSAQAAPMLEPYYASGQVKGMLSGLNGSAVYGQLAQQPGDARRYWDAYQYGLIAIILIILIGGAIQFVQTLISRRKA